MKKIAILLLIPFYCFAATESDINVVIQVPSEAGFSLDFSPGISSNILNLHQIRIDETRHTLFTGAQAVYFARQNHLAWIKVKNTSDRNLLVDLHIPLSTPPAHTKLKISESNDYGSSTFFHLKSKNSKHTAIPYRLFLTKGTSPLYPSYEIKKGEIIDAKRLQHGTNKLFAFIPKAILPDLDQRLGLYHSGVILTYEAN